MFRDSKKLFANKTRDFTEADAENSLRKLKVNES